MCPRQPSRYRRDDDITSAITIPSQQFSSVRARASIASVCVCVGVFVRARARSLVCVGDGGEKLLGAKVFVHACVRMLMFVVCV